MTSKLIVGPINKGVTTNVLPFNIDNDAFPKLINAYQWRGRIKRRRGDVYLNRLARYFPDASIGNTGASPWTINTIYSTYIPAVTPETNATIVPGSVVITIASTPEIVFTDNGDATLSGVKNGTITGATQANPCEITSAGHTLLTGNSVTINSVTGMTELNGLTYVITVTGANTFTLDGIDSTGFTPYGGGGTWSSPSSTNTGTINYITGVITLTHTAGAAVAATAIFAYYPVLPVMGLEDYLDKDEAFVQKIGFDTKYAYNVTTFEPYFMYSVSYYKNPAVSASLTNYVPKTTWTPLVWNGEDYQQFWTTNYEGAFWATNGVEVPFDITNIGMQYKPIVSVTVIAGGPPATATLNIIAHGLVVGDFVFVNEVATTTGINFQTGYVITVTDVDNVIVEFPSATIATNGTGGIAQYLTSSADSTKDCIRWYDGDPTNGSIVAPGFTEGKGWVNFMPPLSQFSFNVGDVPQAQYYLVGAKILTQFKDRLVIFGPVIQTSAAGSQIYLEDTILYSQNGTPFYTSSYTGDPVSADVVQTPVLVPVNQIASAASWFGDQTGFGGYIDSGLDESINTIGNNEDVLILGFDSSKVKLIYTGNDIVPFNLYTVNSELGGTSTFSVINMDQGILDRGTRGYTITNQSSCQRIDLANPNQVFKIQQLDNGTERFTAIRDFFNEWVYFTYPPNSEDPTQYRFPTQTFLYNYRDNSWAIFNECFTTYGAFKKRTGFTWATVGNIFPTWADWNQPWDAGNSTELQESVIGGTPQGFVLQRAQGTGGGESVAILGISGNTITSPDHCLDTGSYITISGVLGTIGQEVNGKIFSVAPAVTLNSFTLNPTIEGTGTYLGGGVIKRLYVPQIQTKEFPVAWADARKTRLGVQQYLLTKTKKGQITLNIYLSTADADAFNDGPIVPEIEPENSALVYSTVLYTCPESTNLGLTPSNTNLQQINLIGTSGTSQNPQRQIWHRINTSLIGDTVQLGFTLSDEQMRVFEDTGLSFAITGATQATSAVISTTGNFGLNQMVRITGIEGMTELNYDESEYNIYRVIATSTTSVTLEVDSSGFTAYEEGGVITTVANPNNTEEIELHGFILNVSPSMMLS